MWSTGRIKRIWDLGKHSSSCLHSPPPPLAFFFKTLVQHQVVLACQPDASLSRSHIIINAYFHYQKITCCWLKKIPNSLAQKGFQQYIKPHIFQLQQGFFSFADLFLITQGANMSWFWALIWCFVYSDDLLITLSMTCQSAAMESGWFGLSWKCWYAHISCALRTEEFKEMH